MKEKYSGYEFELTRELVPIWDAKGKTEKTIPGYIYKIPYWHDYYACEDYIESHEWYDTEQQARFAAIERIDLLENGEG